MNFQALDHVGISVADLDRSIGFWERLLAAPPRDRRIREGPRLGTLVGYEGVRIDSCWFDFPGGVGLELLHYLGRPEAPYDPGTAHPGNAHVCLRVDDMEAAHAHAVACGGRAVSAPIEVPAGPEAGTRIAYVRTPDGVTIELHQPPARA
ncbi:MAG: VOC family protein [Actinomycetota bacterium]|nr:VOC family protein [Actinomycetota bacterium]